MYNKNELQQIHKDIKVKKFFKLLYRDFDEDNEYIRIFQNDNQGNCKEKYFNDIDSVVNYVTGNNKFNRNTYFEINTTDGQGGKTENLKYAYCLFFDFDKKDLGEDFDHKSIYHIFSTYKIHYSLLISTGHGYHVYVLIQKTNDFEKVNTVQKVLAEKIEADLNATKKTQLARSPYSYNIKNPDKIELVKLMALDRREEVRPYDINFLYEKNCTPKDLDKLNTDKNNTKWILNNTNIPNCIENIINNGSPVGRRYEDLQRIVVVLRQRNKTLKDILSVAKVWAEKSAYDKNLEYEVNNIFKNRQYVHLECKSCDRKSECYNYIESEFDFEKLKDDEGNTYDTYQLEDKISKKIRNKRNGSDKMLNPNEVLILNVLRHEHENYRPLTKNGMCIKLLTQSLTYKKKCCMSEKTLRNTLKTLLEKGFIIENEGQRKKKYYAFNPIRANIQNTIKISYFATVMCITGVISKSELSLYILMRYIHNQQLKTGDTRGNRCVCSQTDLAKKYYGSCTDENRTNINKMIHNLIEAHVMDIWDKQNSKNNGWTYNIYRLLS